LNLETGTVGNLGLSAAAEPTLMPTTFALVQRVFDVNHASIEKTIELNLGAGVCPMVYDCGQKINGEVNKCLIIAIALAIGMDPVVVLSQVRRVADKFMETKPFDSLSNADQVIIADVVNRDMMLDPNIFRFLKVPCLRESDVLILSRPDQGSPCCDLFLHDESVISHRLIVLYFSKLHYHVVHLPTQFSTAGAVVEFMRGLIPPEHFITHKMASAIPHSRVDLFSSSSSPQESDDDSDEIVSMGAGKLISSRKIEQRKEPLMPRKEDDADDEGDGDEGDGDSDEGDGGSDHGDGGSGGFITPKKHLSEKKQRRK
jgi:hypothetical protein